MEEVQKGDPIAAQKRLDVLSSLPVLPITKEVTQLAEAYLSELPVPVTAKADMIHLAVASMNAMNYLLTWNCKHIANGYVIQALAKLNGKIGIVTPIICTPEELLHEDSSDSD